MNAERPEVPGLRSGESFDTDDVDPGIRVASPCVGVCVINDDTGRCAGCHRTLDEVAAWSSYSEAQRRPAGHGSNSSALPLRPTTPPAVRSCLASVDEPD